MINTAALPMILLTIAAGIAMAVQSPTNAMLAKASGSPFVAAFISFAVGLVPLAIFVLTAMPARIAAPAVRALPWYAWLGGLYGVIFLSIFAFAAPRLGLGTLVAASVLGQMIAALILDHYGFFGLAQQPVNWQRILGAALVLAGVIVIRRN